MRQHEDAAARKLQRAGPLLPFEQAHRTTGGIKQHAVAAGQQQAVSGGVGKRHRSQYRKLTAGAHGEGSGFAHLPRHQPGLRGNRKIADAHVALPANRQIAARLDAVELELRKPVPARWRGQTIAHHGRFRPVVQQDQFIGVRRFAKLACRGNSDIAGRQGHACAGGKAIKLDQAPGVGSKRIVGIGQRLNRDVPQRIEQDIALPHRADHDVVLRPDRPATGHRISGGKRTDHDIAAKRRQGRVAQRFDKFGVDRAIRRDEDVAFDGEDFVEVERSG
ncbi:hypothetical protein NOLU111490_14885 [Novosphingobium lubricantis]